MAVSEEWKLTSQPRNRFHLSLSKLTTVSLTMMPGVLSCKGQARFPQTMSTHLSQSVYLLSQHQPSRLAEWQTPHHLAVSLHSGFRKQRGRWNRSESGEILRSIFGILSC